MRGPADQRESYPAPRAAVRLGAPSPGESPRGVDEGETRAKADRVLAGEDPFDEASMIDDDEPAATPEETRPDKPPRGRRPDRWFRGERRGIQLGEAKARRRASWVRNIDAARTLATWSAVAECAATARSAAAIARSRVPSVT